MNSEGEQMKVAFHDHDVKVLYHLTSIDNLPSILLRGIHPKNRVDAWSLDYTSIAEPSVQQRRASLRVATQRPGRDKVLRGLHDLVPLYFEPKNPMMYRRRNEQRLCLLVVDVDALCDGSYGIAVSDGNVASHATGVFIGPSALLRVPWEVLRANSWNVFPDGTRQRCAEVLVEPFIEPGCISEVQVATTDDDRVARAAVSEAGLQLRVRCDSRLFFARSAS